MGKIGRVLSDLGVAWWVGQGTVFQLARGGVLTTDDDIDIAYVPRSDVNANGPLWPWGCTAERAYCSASELSRSPFLTALERRMTEEFEGKGFKSFKHGPTDIRVDYPHRRSGGESPGHIIVHTPYFKKEVIPAIIPRARAT